MKLGMIAPSIFKAGGIWAAVAQCAVTARRILSGSDSIRASLPGKNREAASPLARISAAARQSALCAAAAEMPQPANEQDHVA
jgi:hypothetical protein